MTVERAFKRMRIVDDGQRLTLYMGPMEIWDGADLALLREGLMRLIERDGARAIAIDMTFVKYIPSGFFGMLFDWNEKRGVQFWLTPPQPNVQAMLWFTRFFRPVSDSLYELCPANEAITEDLGDDLEDELPVDEPTSVSANITAAADGLASGRHAVAG